MMFKNLMSRFVLTLVRTMSTLGSKQSGNMKTFPKTIVEFGFDFDDNGVLKKLDKETGDLTKNSFDFHVSEDNSYNQKHYEALGEVITDYVYDLLEEKEGLQRLEVPKQNGDSSNQPRSFIFVSPKYEDCEKLIVLIHGSGVVRAGQWARSIIINNNLKSGTQIPYIRKALENGYGVLIMNTNDNIRDGVQIPGSKDAVTHAETVWRDYIAPCKARQIGIVAHSYGGIVTAHLASQFESDFLSRVFAIAFTDSVHRSLQSTLPSKLYSHMLKICKNWICSEKALDEPIEESTSYDDVIRISAGTRKHELTSWSAFESVFKFFSQMSPSDNENEVDHTEL